MTSKIIFGEMVDYFRQQYSMTMEDLGNAMGKTKSTVSRWISGERYPKIEEVEKLAEIFNTDVETILFGANQPNTDITQIYNQLEPPRQTRVYQFAEYQLEEQNKVTNIDDYITETLRGYVSAGTGEYLAEEINEEVQLPKDIVPEQRYDMVLKINGNSMSPMFQHDEFIFVRKVENFRSGQIGVFIIDGESYLKKAYIEDSYIRLVSLNKNYDDLIFKDESRIELIGTVVM